MTKSGYGFPIRTAGQTRAMDAGVESGFGLPLAVLMENAGRVTADAAARFNARRIFVAAGSGNNGGDALAAARFLQLYGNDVTVVLSKPPAELQGLPALQYRRAGDAGVRFIDADADWTYADLIIDGLLGTGLTSEPHGNVSSLIDAINNSGRPLLSIDVPSGVQSDSAATPKTAIRATATVALDCWKPALAHYPAAEWAGTVISADIGMPASIAAAADSFILGRRWVRDNLPHWGVDTNKGRRGTLVVIAGSRGMTGAAAMACQSAIHAGAGLVYLVCPESLTPIFEVKLTEAIMRPVPDGGAGHFTPASVEAALEAVSRADAVVLGPGLSHDDAVADFVTALLPKIDKPILIDADGLNILGSRGLRPPANAVLTPHPGEMGRLLGQSVEDVQKDREATVRAAAEKFDCAVLLKGAHTVITAPGEPVVVNTVGHSVLATAGSGDVLSGVTGALLAQEAGPFHAALLGVRWHGTAGVLAASKRGGTLGATDILGVLPEAREEMLCDHNEEILV